MIAGGGSPEAELTYQLSQWAKTLLVSAALHSYVLSPHPSSPCYSLAWLRLATHTPQYKLTTTPQHQAHSLQLRLHFITPVPPTAPQGMESYCVRSFAEALEIIPYTLAENAGLNPLQIVTELRNHHASGRRHHGGWDRTGSGWGAVQRQSMGVQVLEACVSPQLTHLLTLSCALHPS